MTPADAHHFEQHPSHVVRRARAIAIEAHAGQVRRYTHVARAEPRAQTIKYADVWHNVQSIARHDPAFAPTYLAEKASLIGRLHRGHPTLRRQVRACIESLIDRLTR